MCSDKFKEGIKKKLAHHLRLLPHGTSQLIPRKEIVKCIKEQPGVEHIEIDKIIDELEQEKTLKRPHDNGNDCYFFNVN